MTDIATSPNGIPIRLPEERWEHILEEHAEMEGFYQGVLKTISRPDSIYQGSEGELLAVQMVETDKALVVVYKEVDGDDGFIITAFLTRRISQLERRKKIWPPQ